MSLQDVAVGRCVCWDGTPSIKRLDSLSNPKLFPDELVSSSGEHGLSHSWNSRSHVISLRSPIFCTLCTFYERSQKLRNRQSHQAEVNIQLLRSWMNEFELMHQNWFMALLLSPFLDRFTCFSASLRPSRKHVYGTTNWPQVRRDPRLYTITLHFSYFSIIQYVNGPSSTLLATCEILMFL